jgi:hypothetical protein
MIKLLIVTVLLGTSTLFSLYASALAAIKIVSHLGILVFGTAMSIMEDQAKLFRKESLPNTLENTSVAARSERIGSTVIPKI